MDKIPLFLIGVPRSGTTLLCKLLRSHPNILMTNESGVFLQMHYAIDIAAKRKPIGFESGIESKEYFTEWSKHLDDRACHLIDSFYQHLAQLEGRNEVIYWGDKHPHYDLCLSNLQRWFPKARYIYIVRNPFDTTCSIAAMNHWDYEKSFKTWNELSANYENQISQIVPSQLLTLRYEDLVANPLGKLQKIFAWLAIATSSEIETRIQELSRVQSHSISQKNESSGHLKTGKTHDPKQSSLGRWKQELSDRETKLINLKASNYLSKYYDNYIF
jgi:hypothetical protein